MNLKTLAAVGLLTTVDASSVMRKSLVEEHNILLTTAFRWDIDTQGIFDEDYGVNYIRLTHKLTGDILPTDIITFDLAFDSKSALVSKTDVITTDSARCEVK